MNVLSQVNREFENTISLLMAGFLKNFAGNLILQTIHKSL